jgi:mRNA interferase MazF
VENLTALIRGGVYLARLDPAKGAEIGKLRPVVILSAQILLDVDPPVVFICPLSSRSDPRFKALHLALPARDGLQLQSYALVEHCRAISRRRILSKRIAMLTPKEVGRLIHRLQRLIGL